MKKIFHMLLYKHYKVTDNRCHSYVSNTTVNRDESKEGKERIGICQILAKRCSYFDKDGSNTIHTSK